MRKIIIMKLKVASGREGEFERFIEERTRAIKAQPGARQVYLLTPLNTNEKEYRFVSWWDTLKDHDSWARKEAYELSHNDKHPGIVVGTVPYEVANVVKEW